MSSTPSATDLTYSSYLRLDELLELAQPTTSMGVPRVHVAELFFITAHQVSELWIRQALVDAREALRLLSSPQPDVEQAVQHLERSAEVVRLLGANLDVLHQLQPVDFAQFRKLLGSASGAQSQQFHDLGRMLGLHGQSSPLMEVVQRLVERLGTSPAEIYRDVPYSRPLDSLLEALTDLSQNCWRWQLMHVHIALRTIGTRRGTGGTTGAKHLADRLSIPFPELWAARAEVHEMADEEGMCDPS